MALQNRYSLLSVPCIRLGDRTLRVSWGSLCLLLTVIGGIILTLKSMLHDRSKPPPKPNLVDAPVDVFIPGNISEVDAERHAPSLLDPLPYTLFTKATVYGSDDSDVPIREITEQEKLWFDRIKTSAIGALQPKTTLEHFTYGWYRHLKHGTEWEVVFRSPSNDGALQTVRMVQPLSPAKVVHKSTVPYNMLVHIAVFASGNLTSLEQFVLHLIKFVSAQDSHISLRILSPNKDLQKERTILTHRMSHNPTVRWTVSNIEEADPLLTLTITDKNSAESSWDLLLILDEMVVVRPDFLSRCRANAVRGKQIYTPNVFSLYNSKFTSGIKGSTVPPLHDLLNHGRDTGTWSLKEKRVACVHRADLASLTHAYSSHLRNTDSSLGSPHYGYVQELYTITEKAKKIKVLSMPDPDVFLQHYTVNCSTTSTSSLMFFGSSSLSKCLRRQASLISSRLVLGLALLETIDGTNPKVVFSTEHVLSGTALFVLVSMIVLSCSMLCLQSCLLFRKHTARKSKRMP